MQSLDQVDWDDIRVFLAVMRGKSLRAAADRLGLSHPTARRRLGGLELQLGLKLFERRRDGLHPTTEADQLLGPSEDVERAMAALGRAAQAADSSLRGPIRVTMPENVATDLLMPQMVEFAERWPEIDLRLQTDYALADLDRREADVAVRFMAVGTRPAEHLAGRLAVTVYRAVYGSDHCWIGWNGDPEDRQWVSKTSYPDLPIRGAFDSTAAQRAACDAGMGLTMLPCFFAEPTLERLTDPEPAWDAWVLVHPDLKRSPRLRRFRDDVVAELKRQEPRLHGRAP